MVSTNRLLLQAGSAIEFDLNGVTRGTLYDALNVASTAPSLTGATLSLVRGFAPAVGASFLLIDNQTAAPVSGTFAGLPEGSLIPLPGGPAMQITYTGGTGNDVVVTAVVATIPTPPTITSFTLSRGTGPGGQDQVSLGGTATASSSVIVETSDSLAQAGWTPLQTIAASPSGQLAITLNQTPGVAQRYFRFRKA